MLDAPTTRGGHGATSIIPLGVIATVFIDIDALMAARRRLARRSALSHMSDSIAAGTECRTSSNRFYHRGPLEQNNGNIFDGGLLKSNY